MKDRKHIYISSGRGPVECEWVVAQVLREIIRFCNDKILDHQIIERNSGMGPSTLKSVLIAVEGNDLDIQLSPWNGTIQWIGKSQFRKYNKRKNWFINVSIIATDEQNQYNNKDIRVETYRASGPGGQHRNKVETAVRVTHTLTGTVVTASDSRSQLRNKEAAIKKLREKLRENEIRNYKKRIDSQWQSTTNIERGNAVKVYEGRKFICQNK